MGGSDPRVVTGPCVLGLCSPGRFASRAEDFFFFFEQRRWPIRPLGLKILLLHHTVMSYPTCFFSCELRAKTVPKPFSVASYPVISSGGLDPPGIVPGTVQLYTRESAVYVTTRAHGKHNDRGPTDSRAGATHPSRSAGSDRLPAHPSNCAVGEANTCSRGLFWPTHSRTSDHLRA